MTSDQDTKHRPPYRRTRGALTVRPAGKAGGERKRFWNQVNNNLVALISLVLAITSLGYNTWRNETTEVQRNWRDASFQILTEIGELNQIILMRRYFSGEGDTQSTSSGADSAIPQPESWVRGWGNVTMVRDISTVMPEPLPEQGQQLFDRWQRHARALHDQSDPEAREEAADTLLGSIEQMRITVVNLISELR
ncbi:MAG TPA: hypothetical protein VKO85_00670 [Wenzhouxiangellaceae bacterium]|nr:hypothetical protein [Wenzhouxiangellaceae bacterium]